MSIHSEEAGGESKEEEEGSCESQRFQFDREMAKSSSKLISPALLSPFVRFVRSTDFQNYFQYGMDFLISGRSHKVYKIIMHSNLVSPNEFPSRLVVVELELKLIPPLFLLPPSFVLRTTLSPEPSNSDGTNAVLGSSRETSTNAQVRSLLSLSIPPGPRPSLN